MDIVFVIGRSMAEELPFMQVMIIGKCEIDFLVEEYMEELKSISSNYLESIRNVLTK